MSTAVVKPWVRQLNNVESGVGSVRTRSRCCCRAAYPVTPTRPELKSVVVNDERCASGPNLRRCHSPSGHEHLVRGIRRVVVTTVTVIRFAAQERSLPNQERTVRSQVMLPSEFLFRSPDVHLISVDNTQIQPTIPPNGLSIGLRRRD